MAGDLVYVSINTGILMEPRSETGTVDTEKYTAYGARLTEEKNKILQTTGYIDEFYWEGGYLHADVDLSGLLDMAVFQRIVEVRKIFKTMCEVFNTSAWESEFEKA